MMSSKSLPEANLDFQKKSVKAFFCNILTAVTYLFNVLENLEFQIQTYKLYIFRKIKRYGQYLKILQIQIIYSNVLLTNYKTDKDK